jgi:helicase
VSAIKFKRIPFHPLAQPTVMGEENRAIQNLSLPREVLAFFQDQWGINQLHPPQYEAMEPLFNKNNILLAIPTASGKSLVAYIAILNQLLNINPGSRAVYIVPLKALASEKFDELKEIGNHLGLKIGLGIGDATSEAKNIDESDILICTSEKLDSLMRTRSELMSNVSVVVADEFHLLHDASRGPTLEINLTRLRTLRPDAQLIALSATVGNCEILAKWLDARLVQSDWRPVDLEYSTLHDRHLEPRKIQSSSLDSATPILSPPRHLEGPLSHPAWIVVQDTIEHGGQVLVFVGTRRSAQSEAKKLSDRVKKRFAKEQPERLIELEQIAESLDGRNQTSMGELLAHCVRGGVAFHHAGLTHRQRQTIESAFKKGLILALCATPTLAAGVNLPARRVLVRDIKRWDDGMSRPLPVMEVHQMLGRAGRPRYDSVGEAWVLCKGTDGWQVADEVSERYFFGPVEDISSKLAAEPAMRMHLLSCVATGGLLHRDSIGSFFDATFLGTTMPTTQLQERLDSMLDWLVEERFLRRLGIDESYEMRRQDRAIDEDESWDDNVPVWVNVAQESGRCFTP